MGDGRSSESDYERCRLNQTIQHSGERKGRPEEPRAEQMPAT